jgi:hypothetical protein
VTGCGNQRVTSDRFDTKKMNSLDRNDGKAGNMLTTTVQTAINVMTYELDL